MTDDLTARLGAALNALEAREEGTRPDPGDLTSLHRDVRRRRVVRTARHASVAAVAVLAVGVAGWWGVRPDPQPATPPAPSPTVTAVPTPSPTSTATVSPPAPTAAAPTGPAREDVDGLAVVTRSGMPDLYEAPPGLLDRTGEGWLLVTSRGDGAGEAPSGSVAAVAPDGTGYLLADLAVPVELVAWSGGPTAVVTLGPTDGTFGVRATLDLRTGDVTADQPVVDRLQELVGTTADGAQVWTAVDADLGVLLEVVRDGQVQVLGDPVRSGGRGTVSPDGRRAALVEYATATRVFVSDLATGATAEVPSGLEGQLCQHLGWWDATTILQLCWEGLDHWLGEGEPGAPTATRLVLVDVTGAAQPSVLAVVGEGDPTPYGSVVHVGGERVVLGAVGQDVAGATPHVWRSGGWERLTDADLGGRALGVVPGAEGTVVVAVHTDDVLVDPDPDLVSIDVRTGEVVRLPSAPGQGAGSATFQDWVAARP